MGSDLSQIFGQNGFDPNSVEPADDFDVLPPGKYPVLIESADGRPTKNGQGFGVNLQFSILDGQFKGRKLFKWINIQHTSQKAQEIGQREFSALGKAIGLISITNTNQLLGKAVIAHVKVKDNDNDIRTFSSTLRGLTSTLAEQSQSTQEATGQQQALAQQQTNTPPWMQNGAVNQQANVNGTPR